MTDEELRSRLVSPPIDQIVVEEIPQINIPLVDAAIGVMESYQNANKWLDTIKEELLIEKGCVFFSDYIHTLAHTMPVRFDKFGDILHLGNMKVPYPETRYIPLRIVDMEEIFSAIFDIINAISEQLRNFIKLTQDTEYHSMACSAEELLIDIEKEYIPLNHMLKAYSTCNQDIIKFDKWVAIYVDKRESLL